MVDLQLPVHSVPITTKDTVCQWLVTGRWFSPSTPVFSTNKTDRHNIIEMLLKVALHTIALTLYVKQTIILWTESLNNDGQQFHELTKRTITLHIKTQNKKGTRTYYTEIQTVAWDRHELTGLNLLMWSWSLPFLIVWSPTTIQI